MRDGNPRWQAHFLQQPALGRLCGTLLLRLLLPGLLDGETEGTGMLAIKGLPNPLTHPVGGGILGQHRHPGNPLKQAVGPGTQVQGQDHSQYDPKRSQTTAEYSHPIQQSTHFRFFPPLGGGKSRGAATKIQNPSFLHFV
jgi:hypothetical protein